MFRYVFLLVLLCLSVMSQASNSNWAFTFYSPLLGTQMGTNALAKEGFDAYDQYLSSAYVFNVATYHTQSIDGWTGPSGFYTKDIRNPLQMVAGYSHTWRMYVWGDMSLNPDARELTFIWYKDSSAPFDKVQFTLTYARSAAGVIDPWNEVGTTILLNNYNDGYTIHLPTYRTTNGLDGYIFDLTATVIPEPSALAVLGAGLVGIMIQRKRR